MDVTAPHAAGENSAPPEAVQREIARLRTEGVLGASGRLRELFDFLAERDHSLPPPKEVEIAVAVFGKSESDALKDDPVARVYVHRLRRKLEDFYRRHDTPNGVRLDVPKGQYRLVGVRTDSSASAKPPPHHGAPDSDAPGVMPDDAPTPPHVTTHTASAARRIWPWAAAFAALLLVNLGAWALVARGTDAHDHMKDHPVWAAMEQSARPALVVVGDYYMFGELQDGAYLRRLVRDFTINSREELLQRRAQDPDGHAMYVDVNLDYLPISAAFALGRLLPEAPHDKRLRVALASDVTPQMMRDYDILYVGLLSGLAMLREPVFAQSRFAIGESYDELIDLQTGRAYVTDAFSAEADGGLYRDYGFFSSFHGPSGNRIVIVAGERDAAVTGLADQLSRPGVWASLQDAAGGAQTLEAVFEIDGQQNVSLDSRMLVAAPLDSARIWTAQNGAQNWPAH